MRAAPVASVLAKSVRKDLGIDALRALPADVRSELRPTAEPMRARPSHARPSLDLALPKSRVNTHASYVRAFLEGKVTPLLVAERAFAHARDLASRTPFMGPLYVPDEERAMREARAATDRYARGESRGPLDGVPMVVKEEMDVQGLFTRGGTSWMKVSAAPTDSPPAAGIRGAGTIILGQSPMTELGMNPIGVSGQRTLPRNPHHPEHAAGGSSTGSAVAVAVGLGPASLGADGGGSIRIPAAFSGVFGLKPTFGRVSRACSVGLESTMTHFGPLGASTADLAHVLEVISGADPRDFATQFAAPHQPGDYVRALSRGVKGLRIGIDDAEWADVPEAIGKACDEALAALVLEGAELVKVSIPLARRAPAIGYCSIGLEALSSLYDARRSQLDELGPELQMFCAVLSTFEPDDYLDAQRLRTRLREQTRDALQVADVLAFPAAQTTAPRVTNADMQGFLDPPVLDMVSRYVYVGNLCGNPAASAPIGRDVNGLPIGLQIVGDAWDEACVLQVLAHLERIEAARVERPPAYVDLLA